MIHMMLTNDKRIFEDVKSVPTISLDSDHRMVLGKLRWKSWKTPRRKVEKDTVWRN